MAKKSKLEFTHLEIGEKVFIEIYGNPNYIRHGEIGEIQININSLGKGEIQILYGIKQKNSISNYIINSTDVIAVDSNQINKDLVLEYEKDLSTNLTTYKPKISLIKLKNLLGK